MEEATMPKILDRCHSRLMADSDFTPQDGKTKSESAYAVCTASLQKAGLVKKGTSELTDKGRQREAEMMAASSSILANIGNLTFDDVEEAIRDALYEQYQELSPVGEQIGEIPYVQDVLYLDEQVIYRYQSKYWKAPFLINPDYTATVGKGIPVVQVWVEASGDTIWKADDGKELMGLMPVIAAAWSEAFINELPDESFLYIEAGAEKDDKGKSKRSKRHFPYKMADGTVDLMHLRNALATIPQSSLPEITRAMVERKAKRIARASGIESEAITSATAGNGANEIPSHLLRFQLLSRSGRGTLALKEINADRGISALMDGEIRVEVLFDTREPHRWTMADAKKWLSRPIICAGSMAMEVLADGPDVPGPVADAIKKLKDAGLSPFIVRIRGTIGKFKASTGPINLTPEFYRAFGQGFVGKPYFQGHKGLDSADFREKIGVTVGFDYPDGQAPSWYVNISEGKPEIRKQFLEEQALGVSEERTGASSVEGKVSQEVDRDGDGYMEPTKFTPMGIALVRKEAATGTTVDHIFQ